MADDDHNIAKGGESLGHCPNMLVDRLTQELSIHRLCFVGYLVPLGCKMLRVRRPLCLAADDELGGELPHQLRADCRLREPMAAFFAARARYMYPVIGWKSWKPSCRISNALPKAA